MIANFSDVGLGGGMHSTECLLVLHRNGKYNTIWYDKYPA